MKIVFIGSGNVATHLANAFYENDIQIVQIYSKTIENAKLLAEQTNANFTDDITKIIDDGDIYFFCIKDDFLESVLKKIDLKNKFTVHTSGSIPIELLNKYSDKTGVFYPFQTFSKNSKPDFSKIPICIESNSESNKEKLENLAKTLTGKIFYLNSEQRQYLHIAGVFANNFVNFMYYSAESVLNKNNLPFELIKPLIDATAQKVQTLQPKEAQTGPAIRNDKKIIKKHLELLKNSPELKKIYSFVSDMIIKNQF